jgi:hypothetical protein
MPAGMHLPMVRLYRLLFRKTVWKIKYERDSNDAREGEER